MTDAVRIGVVGCGSVMQHSYSRQINNLKQRGHVDKVTIEGRVLKWVNTEGKRFSTYQRFSFLSNSMPVISMMRCWICSMSRLRFSTRTVKSRAEVTSVRRWVPIGTDTCI